MVGEGDRSLLAAATPELWAELVDAAGPASMLVLIRSEMGPVLLSRMSAEDVWQETLLQAWRDRTRFEWRGSASFRRWLITIARHRMKDFVEGACAAKRGGGDEPISIEGSGESGGDESGPGLWAGPVATTTPSRIAAAHEAAARMESALGALADDLREVVRLRLFEDLTIEEIASRLSLGESAVRHRFRRGAAAYHALLFPEDRAESTAAGGADPA